MRQPKLLRNIKNYCSKNKKIKIVVGLFTSPKGKCKDSVMLGVDCRNYKADDFHATMEEINLSTEADEFCCCFGNDCECFGYGRVSGASGADDKTARCSRVSYFESDGIF